MVGGEVGGRKLRPRVTRSAAMAPEVSRKSVANENTGALLSGVSGHPRKRAAPTSNNDENKENLVGGLGPRKRAALSNLTNNVSSKPAQGKTKSEIVSVQQKPVGVTHEKPIIMQQVNVEVKHEKTVGAQEVNVDLIKPNFKLKSETIPTEIPVLHHHLEERIAEVISNVPMPEVTCLVEGEGWSCKNYTDIDDNKDPQMCSTYAAEIYFHLRTAELKRRPAINFMETLQQDINTSMRSILMDWLVEVAEEYKLVPDTLYLTATFIDRYLSENVVTRQSLQLLGVSCMLIASKYEEICPPQVDEFCYITDNTYGRREVLEMEKKVLDRLKFELAGPTTKTFLRRFVRAAQAGQKISTLQMEFLGNYLAELTLVEYGFLQYLPSMIAGSAVFLAKVTLDPTSRPWNVTLQHYSGYKPSDLKECVKAIHDLQCNKKHCTLPAVREKYKQAKFKSVSSLPPLTSIPLKYFEDVL